MNDYWNDPPEEPELPECCDEVMNLLDDGACVCSVCGKRIEPPKEEISEPEDVDFVTEE